MADKEELPATTFTCEEFDEYLLIEDAGQASPSVPVRGTCDPEQIISEGSSLDSGYEGKHSRTTSPEEVKQDQETCQLHGQQVVSSLKGPGRATWGFDRFWSQILAQGAGHLTTAVW
jgi:hypothetical protein